MSPTKIKERTVKGSGKDTRKITITPEDDGWVTITWLCGTEYEFGLKDLTKQLQRIELFATRWTGVWIIDTDSHGEPYAAKVEGGRFYAGEAPYESAEASVSWTNLKNALTAVIKDQQSSVNQQQEDA